MNTQQEKICKFLYTHPNSRFPEISLGVKDNNSVILWNDMKELIDEGIIIKSGFCSHVEEYNIKPGFMSVIFQ